MADITARLDMAGAAEVVTRLRGQLAALVREAATREKDARVGIRLNEVAYALMQDISHAEAVERLKTAPTTGLPRMATTMAGGNRPSARTATDAVATTGGKATVETLKP